jgi:hypothetical protein
LLQTARQVETVPQAHDEGGEGIAFMISRPSSIPCVSRIDQPSHLTHGFFVRLQRKGKIHTAFFKDKKHGGRARALAVAQAHQRKLAAILETPVRMSRRAWAEIRRRKNPTESSACNGR